MSPLSPHRPSVSLDHMATHHTQRKSLPNIKQEIPSDDLIETLHQFNQQQRDMEENELRDVLEEEDDNITEENDENDENDHLKFSNQKQLNSDDIIVPVSSNNQPNLQYPPSYQYVDNGTTISFMNSKLQKTTSRSALSSMNTTELYPALQFETNFITTIPESFSNSTISSYDSVPPTLTHSITNSFSNASLQISPSQQQQQQQQLHQQQQQQQQTPARANRKHSISNGGATIQTPLQLHTSNIPQYQTPARKTPSRTPHRKGHARSRSRLSLDANGSAAVVSINGSSTTTLKSPGGVNPFYTPPSFVSPRSNSLDSPQQHFDPSQQIQTPFATPLHPAAGVDKLGVSPYLLARKEDTYRQKRFKSNEFHDFTKAADLSLQLADKLMNNSEESLNVPLMIDSENNEGLDDEILNFNQNQNHQYSHDFDSISRSRSSMNLATTLMNSPTNPDVSGQSQFMPIHHNRDASIPQNMYTQFDKLNFIPEIQHQPYAPLVQFPPSDSMQQQQQQQQHHHQSMPQSVGQQCSQESHYDELIVENKKEKKQKIHQCPLCGGRFQRPEHVKRHMRSHSSEKPYMCGICNKRFNRNDNMKAHERKIHGIDKCKKQGTTNTTTGTNETLVDL